LKPDSVGKKSSISLYKKIKTKHWMKRSARWPRLDNGGKFERLALKQGNDQCLLISEAGLAFRVE
jgi:hypothetical protein